MVIRSLPLRKAVAAAALPLLLLGTAACGIEKTEKADDTATPSDASTPSETPATSEPTDAPSTPSTPAEWNGTCTYVKDGSVPAKESKVPSAKPKLKNSYTATLKTSAGDIVVKLDPKRAPCTVNNFVSLARQGYYDDTLCHRVIPGFMAQCGDPSASGSGGPGYSFDDELHGDESYVPGALAMANSGPATNGSQFFIVTGEATHLTTHTIFGQADEESVQKLLAVEQQAQSEGIKVTRVTVR